MRFKNSAGERKWQKGKTLKISIVINRDTDVFVASCVPLSSFIMIMTIYYLFCIKVNLPSSSSPPKTTSSSSYLNFLPLVTFFLDPYFISSSCLCLYSDKLFKIHVCTTAAAATLIDVAKYIWDTERDVTLKYLRCIYGRVARTTASKARLEFPKFV